MGPKTWALLQEWYGGGPAFPRTVIMRGYQESVELYPQPCTVRLCGTDGEPGTTAQTVLLPRGSTGVEIVSRAAAALGQPAAACRVWAKVSQGNQQAKDPPPPPPPPLPPAPFPAPGSAPQPRPNLPASLRPHPCTATPCLLYV